MAREKMKPIYRILIYLMCALPGVAGAAPVATTAGDNLTAYNPSSMGSISNNQWNSMLNGRTGANTAPTADFGNCNALIMRCASPKCSGCTTLDIARPIVMGCVNTNSACKQYGDDLIEYISAQIVSSTNAKTQQATINANAAAAQNAATQNNAQIQQLQEQMANMQASMQAQNAETIRQLENALAEQKKMTADAQQQVADAKIAQNATNESGITAAQQAAIDRGVDTDLVVRADITGEIMSKIENAETNLKNVYNTMQTAFTYAECDARGNNCTAPRRVKTFKDKAIQFVRPYDEVIDDMYSALETAMAVGVDVSDVIMTLNNSCNQWGEYICTGQTVTLAQKDNGKIIGSDGKKYERITTDDYHYEYYDGDTCVKNRSKPVNGFHIKGGQECRVGQAIPPQDDTRCTLNKLIAANSDEVKRIWLEEHEDSDKLIRVGCATSALNSLSILGRRNSRQGASLDLDTLERMILQEPSDTEEAETAKKYCCCDDPDGTSPCTASKCDTSKLRNYTILKNLPAKACAEYNSSNSTFTPAECGGDNADAAYINPAFALCSVHAYNAGLVENPGDDNAEKRTQMQDVIALKTTIIAQQMYKQYEQMVSLLNRLKTQLQKAVLANRLQVAGGKSSSNNDDDTYSASSEKLEDKLADCSQQTSDEAELNCHETNTTTLSNELSQKGASITLRKALVNNYTSIKGITYQGGDKECSGDKCNTGMKINKQTFEACLADTRSCLRTKRRYYDMYKADLLRGTTK